ncbi:MAG: hypothetical protein VKI81_12510, partial [Synechococcaceae cyanobacterium]|nr:hypothetical protein [Synechococcaceae cyanobacterium]
MPAAALLLPILLLGAADEPAFTVAGELRTDRGFAAGARVQVYDLLAPSVLLGEARSGDDGRFAVAVGRDVALAREHPWAPVLVRVDAEGFARRAAESELGGDPVELQLVPPVVREGTLVDGDGRPVPGAFLL